MHACIGAHPYPVHAIALGFPVVHRLFKTAPLRRGLDFRPPIGIGIDAEVIVRLRIGPALAARTGEGDGTPAILGEVRNEWRHCSDEVCFPCHGAHLACRVFHLSR